VVEIGDAALARAAERVLARERDEAIGITTKSTRSIYGIRI